MLTHDEVVWGYRYILGRDPESAEVVSATAPAVPDVPTFRKILLRSPEFESVLDRPSWFAESCWVAAPVFGGSRLLWLDLSDTYVSQGCLRGSYEMSETGFLRKILKSGDTFVDVGANVGWYTLLASTIVGDRGQVHAFEPRRPIVEYLQRTVVLNRLEKLVTVYPLGLSDQPKTETLMWGAGSTNGGGASFARGDPTNGMTYQQIEVRSLDSFKFGRVDVIKIDVEGAEPLVVDGAKATIDRDRPIVLTEVLPSELRRVSGYSPQQYFDFFLSREYNGFIVQGFRLGQQVYGFPESVDVELVNIGFIPNERPIDPSLFKL